MKLWPSVHNPLIYAPGIAKGNKKCWSFLILTAISLPLCPDIHLLVFILFPNMFTSDDIPIGIQFSMYSAILFLFFSHWSNAYLCHKCHWWWLQFGRFNISVHINLLSYLLIDVKKTKKKIRITNSLLKSAISSFLHINYISYGSFWKYDIKHAFIVAWFTLHTSHVKPSIPSIHDAYGHMPLISLRL